MLQVNPNNRITVKELLTHPWINATYNQSDIIQVRKQLLDDEVNLTNLL